MDDKQSQGSADIKPTVDEKLAEMKQESQSLAERSKTVDQRLENLIHPQAVETKQPEPTPSSNQTTEEVKPVPEIPSVPQEQEQSMQPDSVTEEDALANSKNPERTKEYIDSLKAQLQKEREDRRKAAGDSVFDSLRPTEVPSTDLSQQFGNLNLQQQQQIAQDFITPDGVDVDGLNKALRLANDRAYLAELAAQKAQQVAQQADERQQVREAHALYPELDPKQQDKFDPNFYDLVALKIAKSGMKLTLSQAAEEVKKTYSPASINLDKVKDEAVTQYKANQAKRNQEPLSSGTGAQRVVETSNDLRERTRKGDAYALDERLRKLGLIN